MSTSVQTLRHAGLTVYAKPKSSNKWHLPVCSSMKKDLLMQLGPQHPNKWEEVDFDGCPTICYVLTGNLVKTLNKARLFTSFYATFADCLGSGPAKTFFPELWLKANNLKARARNRWESMHHCLYAADSGRHAYTSMSMRQAARLSIC